MQGNDSDRQNGLPRLKERDVYGPNDPLPVDGKEPFWGPGWPALAIGAVSIGIATAFHGSEPTMAVIGGIIGVVVSAVLYQFLR